MQKDHTYLLKCKHTKNTKMGACEKKMPACGAWGTCSPPAPPAKSKMSNRGSKMADVVRKGVYP